MYINDIGHRGAALLMVTNFFDKFVLYWNKLAVQLEEMKSKTEEITYQLKVSGPAFST